MPIRAGRHCTCWKKLWHKESPTHNTHWQMTSSLFFLRGCLCVTPSTTRWRPICVFFSFFYEPFLRLGGALVVTIYRLQSSEVNINRIMKQSLQSVLMMEEIRGVICGGWEETRKRTVGSCGWSRRRIGCCVMICVRHQTAQLPVQPWWHSAAESLMLRTAKKMRKLFLSFFFYATQRWESTGRVAGGNFFIHAGGSSGFHWIDRHWGCFPASVG